MPKTIIMIHAACGSYRSWEFYRPWFEERGWEVLTPNLRLHDGEPHGAPPDGLGTTSIADYVGDLEKEIDRLDEPPVLMGHSLGALIVQILAARGKAKAGILLTPAAPAGIVVVTKKMIAALLPIVLTWGWWRKPLSFTRDQCDTLIMCPLSDAEVDHEYSKLVAESGRAFFEFAFWNFDRRRTTRVDERKVTCPLLVVTGSADMLLPASAGRKIVKKYGKYATAKVIEGMDHWPIAGAHAKEVADYSAEWLDEFLAPARLKTSTDAGESAAAAQ